MNILNKNVMRRILEIARYAPSVHNTQPWKVSFNKNVVTVRLDTAHSLTDGDPTGRQTYISMGIFAEAIKIGAEHNSIEVTNIKLAENGFTLTVAKAKKTTKQNKILTKNLKNRCSDRSIYRKITISPDIIENIHKCVHPKTTTISIVTEKNIIDKIADYTSKGITLAMSSPSFRKELSRYLTQPWSKSNRGISVKSLYIPYLLSILQPTMVRLGMHTKAEAVLEKKRWKSASGIVLISSSGDMPAHWFDAGMCYLKVSLAIENSGISQATSAAIIEASTFHEDVEQLIATDKRLLAVIRIGKGSKKRHYSPRLSADELLTSNR